MDEGKAGEGLSQPVFGPNPHISAGEGWGVKPVVEALAHTCVHPSQHPPSQGYFESVEI